MEMIKSKFTAFGVSALAFLVISALLINLATVVVDFYYGLGGDDVGDSGISDIIEDTPSDNEDDNNPDDGKENPESPKNYLTNLSSVMGPSLVEGLIENFGLVSAEERNALYSKLTADIVSADTLENVELSLSGVYNGESFTLAKAGIELPEMFSVGTETIKVPVKTVSSSDASVKVTYEEREADIKTVELYMGYVIINSQDGKSSLYDSYGRLLVADMGNKEAANKRVYSGEAVFTDDKGAYYILDENNEFVSVAKDKILAGLEYDYPYNIYKNESGEQIYAYYLSSKKVYKYHNASSDKDSIKTSYANAYNFGPTGYAFVKTTGSSGNYYIIDTTGKIVEKAKAPTSNYLYKIAAGYSVYVRRYYSLPYVNDISSIGSGTVDEHGWIRVRVRISGRSSGVYNKIIADYETLVNLSGEFFEIPDGYTLEGYSDGVLLLSKNGRYGYYSIEGKWIAQPIYTYASPFIQGLAAVGYVDGTRGMIDTDGNIVLPFAFSYVSNVSSGLVSAYSESGGWEIFTVNEAVSQEDDSTNTEGPEDVGSEENTENTENTEYTEENTEKQ